MAFAANPLVFMNAEKARDAITAKQQKQISDMYEKWAEDIAKKADWYGQKSTASAPLSRLQALELEKQLRAAGKEMSNQMYKNYKQNIYFVADAVVGANNSWMSSLGFDVAGLDAAFSHVPMQTVNMLITGQLYEGGWNLSSAIWSANEKIQADLYAIMAQGLAENTPLKDVVARMSQYVRPGAKNSKSYIRDAQGHRAFPKSADYNAQRLGKTLLQHSYQQTLVATTKDNPFITKYKWISGSTACVLCAERHGQLYDKDKLPLDHPNGNCAMWPVMDDDVVGKLSDWINSPDGTYPDIDKFANKVGGYVPQKKNSVNYGSKSWLKKNAAPTRMFKTTGLDSKSDRDAIVNRLAAKGVSDNYRMAFSEAQKWVEGWTSKAGGSYYSPSYRSINLTPGFKNKGASENPYNTLFHEMGHAIDDLQNEYGKRIKYSSMDRIGFDKAMMEDLDALYEKINSNPVLWSNETMNELRCLKYNNNTSGVQDVLGAAEFIDDKYKDISNAGYYWGHSKEYWQRNDAKAEAASELFANISAAQVSEEEMNAMKKYFPKAVEKFNEVMEEIAKMAAK